MTTIAPVFVEFRCNRCWYSNCADDESVGTEVECGNCGQAITVPEATPERIARAESMMSELSELQAQPLSADKPLNLKFDHRTSDQELIEIARRESLVPLNQMNFQGYPPASILARLVATIVDNILIFTSFAAGIVFVLWMAKLGAWENPLEAMRYKKEPNLASLVAIATLPIVLVLCQWILLATSGQTIGKKLLMIRIVSTTGVLPGFIQTVVLRNWVRLLFSFVPFLSLIDLLFIFSESRRCLHDYLAGTRVVSSV